MLDEFPRGLLPTGWGERRRRQLPTALALLFLSSSAAACSRSPSAPYASGEAMVMIGSVQGSMVVAPDRISAHEQFQIELVLKNTASEPVEIWSDLHCLARPNVSGGAVSTYLKGVPTVCEVERHWSSLAPGGEARREWTVQIVSGQEGSDAPAPGEYQISAHVDLGPSLGGGTLRHRLIIR